MADYKPKWIKLATNLFDDEKILLIDEMEDADSVLIIWVKLLCLAGKMNNRGVFILGKTPCTVKMLATIFRRDQDDVQRAMDIFVQFGMVEIVDGVVVIPNWGKHQNMDALERKTEYMRNYRARQREEAEKTGVNTTETDSKLLHKTNGKSNGKTKVSRTEEVEEDKKDIVEQGSTPPYKTVVDFLNQKTGKNYRHTSAATKRLINARLSEGYTIEDFKTVISSKCAEWKDDPKMSQYLRPKTLFAPGNFEGYLENAKQPAETSKFA